MCCFLDSFITADLDDSDDKVDLTFFDDGETGEFFWDVQFLADFESMLGLRDEALHDDVLSCKSSSSNLRKHVFEDGINPNPSPDCRSLYTTYSKQQNSMIQYLYIIIINFAIATYDLW